MGYRSQVVFEIWGPKEILKSLFNNAQELMSTYNDLVGDEVLVLRARCLQCDKIEKENAYSLRYSNCSIKWDDVNIDDKVMEQFNSLWVKVRRLNLPATFVRAGEEMGDVDWESTNDCINGNFQDTPNLYAYVSIHTGW